MKTSKKVAGQTEGAGFQIGVRKTMAVAPQQAWDLLTSPAGLSLWLGRAPALQLEPGEIYETEDGIRGEVRVNSGSHLRLTWQPPEWSGSTRGDAQTVARRFGRFAKSTAKGCVDFHGSV